MKGFVVLFLDRDLFNVKRGYLRFKDVLQKHLENFSYLREGFYFVKEVTKKELDLDISKRDVVELFMSDVIDEKTVELNYSQHIVKIVSEVLLYANLFRRASDSIIIGWHNVSIGSLIGKLDIFEGKEAVSKVSKKEVTKGHFYYKNVEEVVQVTVVDKIL